MTRGESRASDEHDERDNWMVAVEGIVVDTDDPENMHRVKVIIPIIDESYVHDEWVTALVPFVGAEGYGPVHRPHINSEVLLFGRLGQRHTLFYLSRFNEDFTVPGEFADGSRGVKNDTIYRLLGELLILIHSQQHVDVKAPLVRLMGGESQVVRVESNKIGFLGNGAIAKQALPAAATDLGSCIALTNAIRTLLINFGFAQ